MGRIAPSTEWSDHPGLLLWKHWGWRSLSSSPMRSVAPEAATADRMREAGSRRSRISRPVFADARPRVGIIIPMNSAHALGATLKRRPLCDFLEYLYL